MRFSLPPLARTVASVSALFALAASVGLASSPVASYAYGSTPASDEPVMAQAMAPAGDIVDIAVADGRFTTLVTALQATDLVGTLEGDGPFTVFAPTDAAFAALPAGTVDALLADPATLKTILLYHVVPGEVTASDVMQLDRARTVEGQDVSISSGDSGVMINNANIVIPDVMASNGVIHVIDAVLLPPAQ